jgi:hypothetical protein
VGRLKCSGATTLARYEPSLLIGSVRYCYCCLLRGCVLDGMLLLQVAWAEPFPKSLSSTTQRQVS